MKREDTLPWYRQFWPWFIIALPASAVVAGLYTLWIALQTGDSLVMRSDDGVNTVTERIIAAEQLAAQYGLLATVSIDSQTNAVSVSIGASDGTHIADTLELYMRHPTMASRDVQIILHRAMQDASGNPVWAGHFTQPLSDRMIMTLSSQDSWRMTAEWSGESILQLGKSRPTGDAGR